jgi:hypothetical protein
MWWGTFILNFYMAFRCHDHNKDFSMPFCSNPSNLLAKVAPIELIFSVLVPLII